MKICMLGFGGIAKSHLKGYMASEAKGSEDKLVAVCDIDPTRFTAKIKMNIDSGKDTLPEHIHTYTDWKEMLATEQPDIVDICLPTYLHCEYTCKILEMGYNVQCEKPMGLNRAECDKMLETARRTGKKLMVGMCLHCEPAYVELKNMVDDGRYGKVRSAHFERLSALPTWGFENWFPDVSRSGGVSLDIHIHDVDIIAWIFGAPKAVSAVTVATEACACRSIHSTFHYEDKIISAVGEWGMSNSWSFSAGYTVNFEKASIVFNTKGKTTVYPNEGEPFDVTFDPKKHMEEEERYFADVVRGAENTVLPPEGAKESVILVEKLMESAAKDGEKVSVR